MGVEKFLISITGNQPDGALGTLERIGAQPLNTIMHSQNANINSAPNDESMRLLVFKNGLSIPCFVVTTPAHILTYIA
jgi:hypothetical protein